MTTTDNRTIKDLAKEALEVGSASNLTGVVHGFSRAMTRLREIARTEGWEGTKAINEHPISVLYSQTISNLTSSESALVFSKAYNHCKDLVGLR